MSRGNNQKLKLLYIIKILLEKTDERHWITLKDLLLELERCGVSAERKSVYADFEALRLYGYDIIKEQKKNTFYYHVGNREFELAELKLLVDAVQSSKFITEKKSRQLIRKLGKLTSEYETRQLRRQVYVHGRVKAMNESIYYNVDKIHAAINCNVQIKFQYYQWNAKKEMIPRHKGIYYHISPWELMWDDENYYLIGYDSGAEIIKHFRVDKMLRITLTDAERDGREKFENINMASYSSRRFGMYNGEEHRVQIEFENQYAGVVIDRFGRNVMMRPLDEGHFVANVDVAVSSQFFGWIMALGSGVKIVGPESVVEQMRREVRMVYEMYEQI